MKKTVLVLAALLLLPSVAVANPVAQRAAATLTNHVMGMLEPQIAELADKAPVPLDAKDELTRQLTEAVRRIVDQEVQGAMGGRLPNANALVNQVVGELANIAQNIIAGILDGSLAGDAASVRQTAPREKPRLRIEPFQVGSGSDGETIVELLSMQSAMQSTFNIVSSGEDADYVLVTETRTLGNATILVMRILNINDSSQIAGENLTFRAIEDIAEQLPQIAPKLAAPLLSPTVVSATQPQVVYVGAPPPPSDIYQNFTIGERFATWGINMLLPGLGSATIMKDWTALIVHPILHIVGVGSMIVVP